MDRIMRTSSVEATEHVAEEISSHLSKRTLFALYGSLGSGKTAFVRGIARGLGITEPVTSPSFTIVSEYHSVLPLIHIDLYRTASDEELELLGLDDLLAKRAVIALEWAEKAKAFLPENYISVHIRIDGNQREIRIEGLGEHTDN